MTDKKDIILPYVEAFKITEVAETLKTSIEFFIEWARRGIIDLYIDASSLYGQLEISCRRDAPIVQNYINRMSKWRKGNDNEFTAMDLLYLLPSDNRSPSLGRRYGRDDFIRDKSTADSFRISVISKGEGFWRIRDSFKRNKIRTINNQEFFRIGYLEQNKRHYDAIQSLPSDYTKGLDVNFRLLDELLVSSSDLYIHSLDYFDLKDNKFSVEENQSKIKDSGYNIGKPSHFYRKFAIDSAFLTREKFPYSKVSDIARRIHSKIIHDFRSRTPPTQNTIANWLYEIKLSKPTIKSNNDFELIIPDEWIDYFE